jgi:hypothetical protein
MKKSIVFVFSLLCSSVFFAQDIPIDSLLGTWKGVITQDAGGYASEYEFELLLTTEDHKSFSGRSYVSLEDIHATMEIQGELIGNQTFTFKEAKIIDEVSKEGMEWCYKNGFLILSQKDNVLKLEGPWSGKTQDGSGCIAGEIFLKKISPRA